MKLSDRGYRKIKAYEGYARRLPDGSCTAYQEKINGKLDIATVGYGCTLGVKMGDVWTEAQADAKLRDEIAKHERRVMQLVTVDINQNEFDSLTSFDFNTGGLAKSTILKRLNAGDRAGAAAAFAQWNKFGGKPSKGLTARRASEAAMFLEPVGDVTPDYMPQTVEASRPPVTATQAATVATVGVSAVTQIPKPPVAILESASAWKGFSVQVLEFGTFALSSPKSIAVILVAGAAVWFGPRLAPKLFGGGS
jgi:lysozyme